MSQEKKLSRREARELCFKLLFAREFNRELEIDAFFNENIDVLEVATNSYVKTTFFGVEESLAELDELIESASVKWKLSRMSTAIRTILRLAAYEMTKTEVPPKVALNEAVEIIKQYDNEDAPAFVNGILNTLARNTGKIDG